MKPTSPEGNQASRRRRRLAGAAVGALVFAEIVRLLALWRQTGTYPRYWAARAAEPLAPNALRVVAFGDSAAMGIGARRPAECLVARIGEYLAERTGRPVHLTNFSTGGGRVATVLEQLHRADLANADAVIVVAGSADAIARVPLGQFRANVRELVERVPADRTILSDVPLQRGSKPYQQALAEVADGAKVAHADFARAFRTARRFDVFAADFTHVNSLGYQIWFSAFRPHLDVLVARLSR
ncbi:SGNH/GDSL hydrolase family protein [Amycolatopsis circi]|uniref:SGNH/GDSL hydrolase family protein n=1 Tax=Amycolatopsis circi TaxID=871959 RepID=UPI000E27D5ED|nr:SGNH/GDSL hydrolase family protein [Amycolatopsis circi]